MRPGACAARGRSPAQARRRFPPRCAAAVRRRRGDGGPGLGRRLTCPEHYEQLKGQKCAAHLIRPDEQGRRDYAGILQGLDADGNVTLTDGEETYAFPVKSAGYVKLCDDEDLFG